MGELAANETTILNNVTGNQTSCASAPIPSAQQYLIGLSEPYVITYAVLGTATLVLIGIFIEEVVRLSLPDAPYRGRREKAKYLLATYPMLAFTAFISLVIPRSASLNDLVSSIYVSVCVYLFVSMLIDLYGGPSIMLEELSTKRLHFDVPPLCCCLRCLPTAKLDRTTLQVLQSMLVQLALVRPFIGYIQAIVWADNMGQLPSTQGSLTASALETLVSKYIGYVSAASALLAMWSFAMIFRVSRGPLRQYDVTPKFVCFQLVLLINSIQPGVVNILVQTNVITCVQGTPPLPAAAVASRWNHIIVICEMFALSVAARLVYFNPKRLQQKPKSELQQNTEDMKSKQSIDSNTTDVFSTSSNWCHCNGHTEEISTVATLSIRPVLTA